MAEARCRHLLLAEGARRRGGARHDHPQPARGRAARDLQAGVAAAQSFPHDQGRQADRRDLEGETINMPSMLCVEDYIDALQWAKSVGGLEGPVRARRRQRQGDRRLGGQDAVGRLPRPRSGDALQHQRLPEGGRQRGDGAAGRGAGGLRQGARRRAGEGEGRLRHRRLSRRPARPAHLVRRDGREGRHRGADPLARLGLRPGESQARQAADSPSPAMREKAAGEPAGRGPPLLRAGRELVAPLPHLPSSGGLCPLPFSPAMRGRGP